MKRRSFIRGLFAAVAAGPSIAKAVGVDGGVVKSVEPVAEVVPSFVGFNYQPGTMATPTFTVTDTFIDTSQEVSLGNAPTFTPIGFNNPSGSSTHIVVTDSYGHGEITFYTGED